MSLILLTFLNVFFFSAITGVAVTTETVATMAVAVTTTVVDMVVQATTERTSSSLRKRLNGIYQSSLSLKNISTRRAKSQLIDPQ